MLLTLLGKHIESSEKREKRLSDKSRSTAKSMANASNTQAKAILPSPMDPLEGNEKPIEVLGQIYSMLKLMDEDNKLDREMVQSHLEEEEHEKDKRNKELIEALTGRGKKLNRKQRRALEKKEKAEKPKEVKPTPVTPPKPPSIIDKAIEVVRNPATQAAVATAAKVGVTAVVAGGLGAAIARGESAKASYNAANKGTRGNKIIGVTEKLDLENMTVGEVMRRQAIKWGAPNENEKLFAVGKYQMIPETMADAVKSMGISPEAKLDGNLQERMFNEYLLGKKRPAIAKYLNSPVDDPKLLHDALKQLSLEWASIADPDIAGGMTSHYGNGNKASLSVKDATMLLKNDREKKFKIEQNAVPNPVPDVTKMSTELDANKKAIKEQANAVQKETNQTNVHNEEVGAQPSEQKKVKDTNPLLDKGKK